MVRAGSWIRTGIRTEGGEAAKVFAMVEDPAAASTRGTPKPAPRLAERRGRPQIPDWRALCGTDAEGQLKALRKGKEAYRADRLAAKC